MKINSAIVIVLTSFLFQCRHSEGNTTYNINDVSGDTIDVDKFNIERRYVLNPKDWIVYSLSADTVCLPKEWIYKVEGNNTFVGSYDHEDNILKYTLLNTVSDNDSIAGKYYDLFINSFKNVSRQPLKKIILEKGMLYEAYTVAKYKDNNYHMVFLFFIEKSIGRQIFLKINDKYAINSKISIKDIIYNIRINGDFIYSSDNKIRRIITISR